MSFNRFSELWPPHVAQFLMHFTVSSVLRESYTRFGLTDNKNCISGNLVKRMQRTFAASHYGRISVDSSTRCSYVLSSIFYLYRGRTVVRITKRILL